MKAQVQRKEIALADFYNEIMISTFVSGYEIKDEYIFLEISIKDTIQIDNCKFQNLRIATKLNNLLINNCEFLSIEIVKDIKSLRISNINCKNSSISIEECEIDKLIVNNNQDISEIQAGIINNAKINLISIFKSKIDHLVLSGEFKNILLHDGNIIDILNIYGKVNQLRFVYSLVIHKNGKPSIYGEINYFNDAEESETLFNNLIVQILTIYNLTKKAKISFEKLQCLKVKFQNCSFGQDGLLIFTDCNNIQDFVFLSSSIKQLNIFNSEFQNTNFNAVQSIFNEINWQFVKWPQKIDNYTNEDFNIPYCVETLRILKLNAIRQQDKFNNILFSSLENEAFRKYLKGNKKNRSDRFILWLNRVSNNHGLDPWQGILFTLVVAAIFFFPNLFLLKNPYWEYGWDGFSAFFNVCGTTLELYIKAIYAVHNIDFLSEYNPMGITYVLDMFGRILVSYGYYQTITAFRKYGKA